MKTSTGRKIRYGGTSIAIVALVIAIVIAINATVTLLTQKFMWYGDMTPELKFTISEACFTLLGEETDNDKSSAVEMIKKFRKENAEFNKNNPTAEKRNENLKVNILFPMEEDKVKSTDVYVYTNANELYAKFSDYITLEYVDALSNPKRFEKYLSSNNDVIDLNSVIIEFGTEFRIRNFKNFYAYNNGEPYAYDAEKAFASSILAVTRAESPLACYTINHGEEKSFPTTTGYQNKETVIPFLNTLENAGFKIQALDLGKEEIPEECRLLITFGPQIDFISGGFENDGELEKLDDFLEDRNAFMVFLNPDIGRLPNLESFLEEWGLAVRRSDNDPLIVKDSANSVLGNPETVISDYSANDLMDVWSEELNRSANVIFENALVLDYAEDYDVTWQTLHKDSSKRFPLAYSNNYSTLGRYVFSMFNTKNTAEAYAGGANVAKSTDNNPFMLMAVSTQTATEMDGVTSLEDSAYVMLCGSTEFASAKYLESKAYGNEDLLLTAFQMCSREPVPTGLYPKEFKNFNIESISARTATVYTVVLTVTPIVVALFAGTIVLVRRKNR